DDQALEGGDVVDRDDEGDGCHRRVVGRIDGEVPGQRVAVLVLRDAGEGVGYRQVDRGDHPWVVRGVSDGDRRGVVGDGHGAGVDGLTAEQGNLVGVAALVRYGRDRRHREADQER